MKNVLGQNRGRLETVKRDVLRLFEMALPIKESRLNGARESIGNSLHISEKASAVFDKSLQEFEREFNKTLAELNAKLDNVSLETINNNTDNEVVRKREIKEQPIEYELINSKIDELNELVCGAKNMFSASPSEVIDYDFVVDENTEECSNGLILAQNKLKYSTEKLTNLFKADEQGYREYLSQVKF